ncbi:MAG: hypothetical protein WDA59_00390 [Methanofastidiosum sp.]
MANTYRMVNLDKMQAIKAGNIVSVKWDGGRLQNGTPVLLGNLVTGERELYYAQCTGATAKLAVTGASTEANVYLVAGPEVMYEAGTMIDDFVVATGYPVRAYALYIGDIFTLSSGAYIGTAALGEYLHMVATGDGSTTGLSCWEVTATLPADYKVVAKCIELTTIGYDSNTAAVFEVVRA